MYASMFTVKSLYVMNVCVIVKMIIPALTDFSKLTTHYSSWLVGSGKIAATTQGS